MCAPKQVVDFGLLLVGLIFHRQIVIMPLKV